MPWRGALSVSDIPLPLILYPIRSQDFSRISAIGCLSRECTKYIVRNLTYANGNYYAGCFFSAMECQFRQLPYCYHPWLPVIFPAVVLHWRQMVSVSLTFTIRLCFVPINSTITVLNIVTTVSY